MIAEKSWIWEEAVSDGRKVIPVDNSDSFKIQEAGVMNGAPPQRVNLLKCIHCIYLRKEILKVESIMIKYLVLISREFSTPKTTVNFIAVS